jgi:uncharacterized protein (TIGR03435 family)
MTSGMLMRMRLPLIVAALVLLTAFPASWSQAAKASFEVASVRPSQHEVGPDYNNQITYAADRFTGKNVTLKRLIAEGWNCQMNQVAGPPWIDHSEYDVEARVPVGTDKKQVALMIRGLLSERFHLKEHTEDRQMRVYELTVAKGGLKIQPMKAGTADTAVGPGFHFRGDMRQFADLLAVQFSIPAASDPNTPVRAGGTTIPVLNKTGLEGIYDFSVDQRPELGTDAFTGWKRVLEEQLGLEIESRKAEVPVIVVDDAEKAPTAN